LLYLVTASVVPASHEAADPQWQVHPAVDTFHFSLNQLITLACYVHDLRDMFFTLLPTVESITCVIDICESTVACLGNPISTL
jgi:hypothetical protein